MSTPATGGRPRRTIARPIARLPLVGQVHGQVEDRAAKLRGHGGDAGRRRATERPTTVAPATSRVPAIRRRRVRWDGRVNGGAPSWRAGGPGLGSIVHRTALGSPNDGVEHWWAMTASPGDEIPTDRPGARLPLTYDECRARFRRAAVVADVAVVTHPITAVGPEGQRLTIDVAQLGSSRPRRALAVLSGVHGVEGFVNSVLQTDLLGRLDPAALPDDTAVLMIHAVNPWGMAWWRRQNESNVDLNRNWRRDEIEPQHNDAYDEIHHLACPATADMPTIDTLLAAATDLVAERGYELGARRHHRRPVPPPRRPPLRRRPHRGVHRHRPAGGHRSARRRPSGS